jgi:hypothetical protein
MANHVSDILNTTLSRSKAPTRMAASRERREKRKEEKTAPLS